MHSCHGLSMIERVQVWLPGFMSNLSRVKYPCHTVILIFFVAINLLILIYVNFNNEK